MTCAQVCHAAGESAAFRIPPEGTHAVVLAASEDALNQIRLRLRDAQVPHVAVRENDAPYEGQLMAIGVAPLEAGVGRWLRHLPLLGKERAR